MHFTCQGRRTRKVKMHNELQRDGFKNLRHAHQFIVVVLKGCSLGRLK